MLTASFENTMPIYLQIVNSIKDDIVSNKLKPGEKVSSVRDLAIKFAVNPNTMQRALSELEREGFLYAERTSGRFVTDNLELISSEKTKIAHLVISDFAKRMFALGYTKDEILEFIREGEIDNGI